MTYAGKKKGGYRLKGRSTRIVYCINPTKKAMPVHPKDVAQFEQSGFKKVW